MDTSWLLDLQALSQTLNFSRAAEARHVTQPAFGRRIRALEDWCGAPLIDRSTHRLQLTPSGRIMLEAATEITHRLDRARNQIAETRDQGAKLTFAATHALSFIFFPGWVQGLGAMAATTPISLLSDNMQECERIMLSGRAQFLLCHHHPASPTGLPPAEFPHLVLARDRLVPVSAPDDAGQPLHALPGRADAPVPTLGFDASSGMGRILETALTRQTQPVHLKPVLTSHLALALKALAIEGRGLAWVPESLVADELRPGGQLVPAGGPDWAVEVDIALFRKRARMSEMAEGFWDLARRPPDPNNPN